MPLSPQHSNHRLWILLGSPFLRSTFPSEEKTEKWWGCSPLSWFFVWLYSSLFSNKSINNGSINNDSMLVMRFHFFSTAGLTVIRDLVCGFKSSWLWFCSLFFRIQIHDLHSGDHRPDVYASMNCCTEQPSLIRITILPIQPLCLMNFMHQSGRRFAKVFPAYQLLQVHCWGGKWGILKQERLGDLRKKHGDIMGHDGI